VVLANQATSRVVSLYRKLGFRLRYLNAPRMIACTGNRTPAREVVATRNLDLAPARRRHAVNPTRHE
jgi:DNA adenine methylase